MNDSIWIGLSIVPGPTGIGKTTVYFIIGFELARKTNKGKLWTVIISAFYLSFATWYAFDQETWFTYVIAGLWALIFSDSYQAWRRKVPS